jgi:hypothetical protein
MAGGEEPAGAAAMAGLGAGLSNRDAVADRDGAGGDALDVADLRRRRCVSSLRQRMLANLSAWLPRFRRCESYASASPRH